MIAGDLGHHSHAQVRWPLGGLPVRIRPFDDGLQSLEPVEPPGHLDAHPGGADRGRLDRGNRPDRQQLHQGPPLCRWRKRGARANAIGISRGGRTTKIHALVDVLGRPLRLVLTPGNTSDVKGADLLIGETIGMKRVIADRGYDANRIRAALREQGTIPVIPGRRNRKRPIQYDERRYKDRWRVEAMFCRLKDFRRIATRYDKLARNFLDQP
jgi:transposase